MGELVAGVVDLSRRIARDLVRNRPDSTHRLGMALDHARAFELIEISISLSNGRSDHQDAMVAHYQYPIITQRVGQSLPVLRLVHEAVPDFVIGDPAIDGESILVGYQQPASLDQRQRRREGRMGVQHAGRLGAVAMDRIVDAECRAVVVVGPLDLGGVRVDHD